METDFKTLPATRDQLILDHLPQVRLIARRIQRRLPENISLDDLISAGVLGLIAAIDQFDPRHHVQLKTYAEYKIRGAILDSLRELDWAPRQRRKRARQIESATAAAEQRWKRAPTEEEVAAELQLTLAEYRAWRVETSGLNFTALERAGDDTGRDLLESVPDRGENLPSRLLERAELRKVLAGAMEEMPAMERTVLRMYYDEELNLRQIARVVCLHESRISQLKSRAIRRLRVRVREQWSLP